MDPERDNRIPWTTPADRKEKVKGFIVPLRNRSITYTDLAARLGISRVTLSADLDEIGVVRRKKAKTGNMEALSMDYQAGKTYALFARGVRKGERAFTGKYEGRYGVNATFRNEFGHARSFNPGQLACMTAQEVKNDDK